MGVEEPQTGCRLGGGAWSVPTLACVACTAAVACTEAVSRPCSSSSCSSSSCSSVGSKLYIGMSWWRSFSSLGGWGQRLLQAGQAGQALSLPPALQVLPADQLTPPCLGS